MTSDTLKTRSRKSLALLARRKGIDGWHSMTKDELVRSLLRAARSKPALPAAKPRRSLASSSTRRPAVRTGQPAKRSKPRSKVNGHVPVVRNRDLCTIEIDDKAKGRVNFIEAVVCDAHWLRTGWELTRDSIRRAESRLGADWHRAVPVLRLFEVVTDDGGSGSDRFVRDVPIEAGVSTWYVHVPPEARTCRVHIGYRTEGGEFFAIAKSNICTLPVLNVNATHRNGKSRGKGHEGTENHRDNGVHRDAGLGRPLGFSSLSHFGPAATAQRETGEFSFKLDTELIVHGSTRPGSCLSVEGEPAELRDDGSFTIRVNQPEGRQVLSFTAMSPTGSERRMIVLAVERNTKELERQYFDGGHPEGFAD